MRIIKEGKIKTKWIDKKKNKINGKKKCPKCKCKFEFEYQIDVYEHLNQLDLNCYWVNCPWCKHSIYLHRVG